MVALFFVNKMRPKRGQRNMGNRSEVKKGVAWSCGANVRQWKYGEEFRGRRSAPTAGEGLKKKHCTGLCKNFISVSI